MSKTASSNLVTVKIKNLNEELDKKTWLIKAKLTKKFDLIIGKKTMTKFIFSDENDNICLLAFGEDAIKLHSDLILEKVYSISNSYIKIDKYDSLKYNLIFNNKTVIEELQNEIIDIKTVQPKLRRKNRYFFKSIYLYLIFNNNILNI